MEEEKPENCRVNHLQYINTENTPKVWTAYVGGGVSGVGTSSQGPPRENSHAEGPEDEVDKEKDFVQ